MKTKMLFTSLLILAAAAMVMTFSTCQKYTTEKQNVKTAQELMDEGYNNGDGKPTVNLYPAVSFIPVSLLTSNGFSAGGTVSVSNGASPITARGIAIGHEYWFANSTVPGQNPWDVVDTIGCGSGSGSFIKTLDTLTENEVYFISAYAKNASGYASEGNEIWSPTSGSVSNCEGSSITDTRDGKVYRITQIGSQCWMADNLNVGTMITGGYGIHSDSSNELIEKFCYNNQIANCNNYGGLYQWKEMLQGEDSSNTNPSGVRGICPEGWHIPSFSEISQLSMFLGGTGYNANSGGKLKETGTAHWKKSNTGGATNQYGFNSIGAGWYAPDNSNGPWFGIKEYGKYWSSTSWWDHDKYRQSFFFENHYNAGRQRHFSFLKTEAYSVRCVKDPAPPTLP